MFYNIKLVDRVAFLIGAVAIFLLIASVAYYGLNNWFQINRIVITGNVPNLNEEYVAKLVRRNLTGTYFTLNIGAIQDEFEKIPWVKRVYVTREFPDTIMVNIQEYVPIINLGHGKLLSKEKYIFNGEDKNNLLPIFTVPDNQIDNALVVMILLNPFMVLHGISLKSLYYNGVGLTKIGFSNNLNIIICGSDIKGQLYSIDRYWDQIYQIESNITSINTCYKDAFAIR